MRFAWSLIVCAALCPASLGQIQFKIDGGAAQNLTSNTINVGALGPGVTKDVHVFDASGVDESVTGQLVIQGSADATAVLRVKVVDQFDVLAFLATPREPLGEGLRDFGGITFSSTSLRDRAVVAVAIAGDITGDIDAAQVWRIDALTYEDATGVHGGHILGSIRTFREGGAVESSVLSSIGYVRAAVRLQGNIVATNAGFLASDSGTWASIDRVVVGSATGTSEGIQGDILAESGRIGSIFTTGPIGAPGAIKQVWAANGITEVRSAIEDGPLVGVAVPFFADIDARRNYVLSPVGNAAGNGPCDLDAPLRRVEATGDFVGDIRAGNLVGDNSFGNGVLVHGTFTGSITIDFCAVHASIVAKSILGPVWIGVQLEGAVVAYGQPSPSDPLAGTLASLKVGLRPRDASFPPLYVGFASGMIGIDCEPLPMPDPHGPDTWFVAQRPCEHGTIDSLVRAARAGVVVVGHLTRAESENGFPTQVECEDARPRIEIGSIDYLKIGTFRDGVVWSGNLEYAGGAVQDDIANDFSAIGDLVVGCMAPTADIWFRDCPRAEIDGHMLGQLHLPRVRSGDSIVIGGSLGGRNDECDCDDRCVGSGDSCYARVTGLTFPPEFSPRVVWPDVERSYATESEFDVGLPLRASIIIHNTGVAAPVLAGQIIINADSGSWGWDGRVLVAEDPPVSVFPFRTLFEGSIQPDKAPYYERVSGSLGGGAVGLVPYKLYATDCQPAHHDDWNYDAEHPPTGTWPAGEPASANRLLNSRFCLPVGDPLKQYATIRFYGPVWTDIAATEDWFLQPYTVYQYVEANPITPWVNVTQVMTLEMGRTESAASRTVKIGTVAPALQPDYYAVVFNTTPPQSAGDQHSVFCGGTTATPPPPPMDNMVVGSGGMVAYYFRLYPDCDADGLVDAQDLPCPSLPGYCFADLDDGTGFDGVCGHCGTIDGGVDISDLIYFLQAFEAGCICVDLDNDGDPAQGVRDEAVDINDLIFFLSRYEGGC